MIGERDAKRGMEGRRGERETHIDKDREREGQREREREREGEGGREINFNGGRKMFFLLPLRERERVAEGRAGGGRESKGGRDGGRET